MEATVMECLDGVSVLQIQRYICTFPVRLQLNTWSRFANQSAHFIAAYGEGLSGAQAAWANKKYHGHRTLPPEWILAAKNSTNV
jgi:hypothetical protein